MSNTFECPIPIVAPLGQEVDSKAVREVWDTYIRPGQERGDVQSIEERLLMSILRAVYAGLTRHEGNH